MNIVKNIRDCSMIDEMRLAYCSDTGKQKEINQDSGYCKKLGNEWILLAVADGVSMSNKPEVASAISMNTCASFLNTQEITHLNAEQLIKTAIEKAHRAILDIPKRGFIFNLPKPQTTIVLALIKDNQLYYGWVGDSRAYVINNEGAKQLTEDDSYINWAIRSGIENYNPKMTHAITQCLGMQEQGLLIHTYNEKINALDTVLLCTDGLWNYYEKLEDFFNLYQSVHKLSAKEKVEFLVNAANKKGGEDNITVTIYLN